jgi:hypothetical protein
MIAFVMLMQYLKYDNGGFIFCFLVVIMSGSIDIFTYIHRSEIKNYLLDYYKKDIKKAEEYYRYQMKFLKISFIITGIILLAGLWALIR